MSDTPVISAPPRTFTPPRPTPVWSCSITLNTDFGQRVYKRAWDRLKADLYVCTVRTRSSGMDEAAKAIEGVITEAFESARKDLESELARVETLMDSVKLTDLPAYKGVQTLEVEFSTPRAKEFLNLIVQMDQLLMRYDALWLTGHIETHPRVQRSQNWQRRLIKIANRLRELANRTRTGINREIDKRTEKHAGPATPPSDTVARPVEEHTASPPPAEDLEDIDSDLDSDTDHRFSEALEIAAELRIQEIQEVVG
jgi:hypothetical protein